MSLWNTPNTHRDAVGRQTSWERAKSRASLNLYFGEFKKKKKKLDLRELPNLGPNEYFSNMGSLIMKYGPRPLILYRLS